MSENNSKSSPTLKKIGDVEYLKLTRDGLKNKRIFVGIRPFRKDGIRLEMQKIKDKKIIYNYGHGGAGVSLAPACGVEAAQLAVKAQPANSKVSVLGSGIIGLMSALECAKKNLKVTIYADRIPQPNEKDPLSMCTSQIAPGFWLPYFYDIPDIIQHLNRATLSYSMYKQWATKSTSIFESTCFQQMDFKIIQQTSPQQLLDTFEKCSIKIGNHEVNGYRFKTFQINLPIFLQQLIQQCKAKGIQFKEKKFKNISDILEIEDDTIIACLGLQSKYLFNDHKVYGVKGHLIEFEKNSDLTGVLILDDQTDFYVFKNRLLIGASMEDSESKEINQELAKHLEKKGYVFYKNTLKVPNPKL